MLRIAARLLAMAALLIVSVVLFYLWRLVPASNPPRLNPWPRRFLGGIARIAGVRIRVTGQPASGRLLLLANHVSWIDIPALSATTGTAFVAHDGLSGVPLLKWLCKMNRTIFVARHDRGSVGAQVEMLRQALVGTASVTIFPEGTTSDGVALLPFKSSLLAALDPLPGGVTVQPVWLDYGPLAPTIAWVGEEPGVANFKRIIARGEPLLLTVHFLEPLSGNMLADRKSITASALAAITQVMAATTLPEPLQITH